MLNVFRRHAYSWGIRVVLGLIVVIFMFWGVGSGLFSQVHPVATVNGQRVLAPELDREADTLRQQLQQMYGPNAVTLLKNVNLRQEALDRIIEKRLVANEARHIGIVVSDDTLQDEIAKQAAFQTDGRFDFDRYQELLRSNNMTPTDYETSMRSALTQDGLRRMIDQGVQISDDQARHAYDLRNEKIALAYVEVPYQQFVSQVSPTGQQVEDYYKKNQESFREPERIKIAYIHYDPQVLAAKINPSDKEIEDYYKRNLKTQFTHPDQVHARHILIEVQAGASADEKAKAKAKAEALLKQAQAPGADFAKLAIANSQDPGSKLQGGDLGIFGRGQMIKPFEEAVFAMKPGEIRLVETRFGFHVIKLDASIPAHTDTLEQARPKLVEAIRAQAGTRLAREALDQDVSAALGGQSLQDIAKKHGVEAIETPEFSQDDAMKVVQDRRLLEAAFKLEPGQVRAVPGGGAPYLVKLISRTPSQVPPFKQIEAKVREAYVRSAAESNARAEAQKLIAQFKNPEEFDKTAQANKLTVRRTDPFPRSTSSIPGLGAFPEVADEAATVAKVPGVIQRVMDKDGNAYIFEVISRAAPSDENWKSASASFTDELLHQRRAEAWTHFLDGLKERAKITVDTSQFGGSAEPSL